MDVITCDQSQRLVRVNATLKMLVSVMKQVHGYRFQTQSIIFQFTFQGDATHYLERIQDSPIETFGQSQKNTAVMPTAWEISPVISNQQSCFLAFFKKLY